MFTPADLHLRVQQFYHRQMGLLDDGLPERWADTFTEDAAFLEPHRLEPLRGRATIRASARARADRLAAQRVHFRHWLNMLDVREQEDGSVRTRVYALAMRTEEGGSLDVFASVVCRDHLRPDGTGWLVRLREIDHDGSDLRTAGAR
ncbi:nuclear transport factor 2 family protein [Actinocorallia sp. API 0066]|uniref:nuclear transport factor 2 family protein n=1 Tax=Actinocorallia sp. API 0066 TaxID=2896846 RepID=UPI001E29AF6A|nr:nuclear transport factor 2 family protein [Actinocorallia sp. API 0066]MCD0452128.1 nuclear transport factor 2 family protein [Actinocorallia sp. API 0066]